MPIAPLRLALANNHARFSQGQKTGIPGRPEVPIQRGTNGLNCSSSVAAANAAWSQYGILRICPSATKRIDESIVLISRCHTRKTPAASRVKEDPRVVFNNVMSNSTVRLTQGHSLIAHAIPNLDAFSKPKSSLSSRRCRHRERAFPRR